MTLWEMGEPTISVHATQWALGFNFTRCHTFDTQHGGMVALMAHHGGLAACKALVLGEEDLEMGVGLCIGGGEGRLWEGGVVHTIHFKRVSSPPPQSHSPSMHSFSHVSIEDAQRQGPMPKEQTKGDKGLACVLSRMTRLSQCLHKVIVTKQHICCPIFLLPSLDEMTQSLKLVQQNKCNPCCCATSMWMELTSILA